MLALNPDKSLAKSIHQLLKIAPKEKSSFSLINAISDFFYLIRIKRLLGSTIKAALSIEASFNTPNYPIDKEAHEKVKGFLKHTKQIKQDLTAHYPNNKSLESLFTQLIAANYRLERVARVKRFSNHTPKETSDFAKAVSSISLENTAKNI